jgi:HAD superfamily hydrolase (TIGR01509 family)
MTKEETKRPKKTIILDNEWVIVKNDWDRVAKLVAESLGVPQKTGNDFKQSLRLYDKSNDNILYRHNRGLLGKDKFWTQVLESYGVEPTHENIGKIADAMSELTTEVDPTAVEAIRKYKQKGYRILMLSNSTPDIYRGNTARHDYFDMFDGCYLSFNTGFRKPETGSYMGILRDYGLEPSDCVLVDDKKENRAAAEELGMTVVDHKIGQGSLEEKLDAELGGEGVGEEN